MSDPIAAELIERISADELNVLLEMLDAFDPEEMKPSELRSLLGTVTPIYLRILAGRPSGRPRLAVVS